MIDTIELAEMLGITRRTASEIIRLVNAELQSKGFYVLTTRPARAPRNEVLKKLHIEERN